MNSWLCAVHPGAPVEPLHTSGEKENEWYSKEHFAKQNRKIHGIAALLQVSAHN